MLLEVLEVAGNANWITAVITAVTLLGSAGAWQFYNNRLKLKYEHRRRERRTDALQRRFEGARGYS